jgi:CPA1 family monovalent cation:H+ antiporter
VTLSAHDALVLLALLAIVTGALVCAFVLRVPYPILLVLTGIVLALIPGLPHPELNPKIVLFGILPPLLYSTAYYTSVRELRRAFRPIASLSLGLVFATVGTVAVVAHAVVPGMSWSSAFVLGAIVAPTDPLAAALIANRIGLPRRLVAIIEGEGLLNDATALVVYRFAVVAAVTGAFSLGHATWKFFVSVAGGIAVGLVVGFVIRQIRRRLDHSPTEIVIALLSGYFAFLPAEALDVSAVLSVVTVGLYMGWYTPELTTAKTRLQGEAVWEIVTFMLNATLFVLVGLELRPIVQSLGDRSTGDLLLWAAAVSATVIATRAAWSWAGANPRSGADALQWGARGPVLGGDARRGHARRGARAAACHRFGLAAPRAQRHRVSRVRRDCGDAGHPGPDAAGARPGGRSAGRSARASGGGVRLGACDGGRARPAGGAARGALGRPNGRPEAQGHL